MRSRSAAKVTTEIDAEQAARDIVEANAKPKKTYQFRHAQARTTKDAELRDDLVDIVETVFIENMKESWDRIKAAIQPIGNRRSEHGILAKKLDHARAISYEAHCLYATAKREYDRWELENEVTNAAMWNEASRAVEQERVDKVRTKPITDGDVRAKIMTLHPDEYIAQETKRKAVKLTVENLTHLVKEANDVVDDYRALLTKLR